MTQPSDTPTPTGNGPVLGWLSGLGWPFLAWLLAGVVSTFTPEPESAFIYALSGSTVVVAAWLVYGSIRMAGFKRGAIRGGLISLGVVAALWAVLSTIQP